MNRIATRFQALAKTQQKAFIAYISAGDPSLDATRDIILALDRAGTDVVEIGVPFSDPMADGLAIQASYERALTKGCTVKGVLEMVRRVRAESQIPLLLFTYLNPVIAYGVENFARDAAQAGADGVLLLDLPPEEDPELLKLFRSHKLASVCLAAPNTNPERATFLAKRSSGFLYYVCRLGVTGERASLPTDLAERVTALKASAGGLPICIGFGISSPDQAAQAAAVSDGAIVGSYLVKLIAENATNPKLAEIVQEKAKALADAVHAVRGLT